MYRHLLIKVDSKEILQLCKGSIQCLNVFTNVLEEHRIPSNMILMKDYGLEDSELMEQVWGLYVATGFYI